MTEYNPARPGELILGDKAGAYPSFDLLAEDTRHGAPAVQTQVTRPSGLPRDVAVSHAMLIDLFQRVETLEVQCVMLQDESILAEQAQNGRLNDAQARIHDLEDAVAGLMDVIHQYEALLASANTRIADAEQRAADAEHWIKTAERGTSEAVEWLYHHVTQILDEPR